VLAPPAAEVREAGAQESGSAGGEETSRLTDMHPEDIVTHLNRFVVGQEAAKKVRFLRGCHWEGGGGSSAEARTAWCLCLAYVQATAIALRQRWRRAQLDADYRWESHATAMCCSDPGKKSRSPPASLSGFLCSTYDTHILPIK
jgi:hypothetical protein